MPCRPPCEHVQTCLSLTENYCRVFNGCFSCCSCHWTLDSGRLCAGKSLLTFPSGSPPPSQRWRPCSCCTQPSTLHNRAHCTTEHTTKPTTQCLDSFHSSCCTAIVGPGRLGGVHTNNTQPAHAGQSRLTQPATSITRTSRHVGLSQKILLVIWVCH